VEGDRAVNELSTGKVGAVPPFGKKSDEVSAVSPRVVVSYRPVEDLTLYASYGEGFRSGFAQNGTVLRASPLAPAIDPDQLNNYEIGAKGRVFDGRLTYDLAAYYIDWKDTVQVLAVTINGVPFNGAVNAEAVDGFGADAGLSADLTDRLNLGMTYSWNDLAFAADVFSGATRIFPEGSRPVESPKYTAGAHVNYSFPIGGNYSAQLSASATRTSPMLIRLANGAPMYGDTITRGRASLNVVSPANWSAMLFVDNFTDEDGRIRQINLPAGQADRLRPRTVGVQLEYKF
jgi:outer membrane receptor protein involved in Fe transport